MALAAYVSPLINIQELYCTNITVLYCTAINFCIFMPDHAFCPEIYTASDSLINQ